MKTETAVLVGSALETRILRLDGPLWKEFNQEQRDFLQDWAQREVEGAQQALRQCLDRFSKKLCWRLSLADGCTVEVTFFGTSPQKKHVLAFAKVFAGIADAFVPEQEVGT